MFIPTATDDAVGDERVGQEEGEVLAGQRRRRRRADDALGARRRRGHRRLRHLHRHHHRLARCVPTDFLFQFFSRLPMFT